MRFKLHSSEKTTQNVIKGHFYDIRVLKFEERILNLNNQKNRGRK